MADKTLKATLVAEDKMSATFAKAGNAAKTLGVEMEQAGSRAKAAWDKTRATFDANSRQIGASAGIIASGLALAGQSAFNHQREIDALGRVYGNTAPQLISFTKNMEQLTNVTDDQALVMANTMATLVQNYGMSVEQIEVLIQRTIDLAALKGKSFEEAAAMVQSAMRGEAEYAEQLGLTLNDAALGIDKMAKSTTDAEKAQIRYNAYLEQSAYAVGYAGEQAEGFYGSMYDLKSEILDGSQALGEFLGPFGELGAFAAENAVQIAALTLAAGQMGSTLKATGLLALGGRGALAGAGILAGPVGLAALFAGGAYLFSQSGTRGDGVTQEDLLAQAEQGGAWLDLIKSQMASTDAAAYYQIQQGEAATRYVTDQLSLLGELSDAIEGVGDKTLEDLGYTREEATAAFTGIVDDLVGPGGNVSDVYKGLAEFEGDIATIFTNSGPGRKDAIQDYKNLISQWESGSLTAVEVMKGVDGIADSLDSYNLRAQDSIDTTEGLGKALGGIADVGQGAIDSVAALGMGAALTLGQIEQLGKQLEDQFNLATAAYMGTTDALNSGFQVIVGNTNAIASQAQAVADWAENLIAAEGVYSRLDDLVAEGRISGESGVFTGSSDYAIAQRAYNSIIADNAEIQENILAIQAQQAPTLAALVDQQEKYIAGLTQAEPAVQALALAYMDSSTSAQALQLAQGYIADQDTFGPMIEQAVALNPYLAMILEDMGIIERGGQGEISLTGIEDNQDKLDSLTQAIGALVQATWIATFEGNTEAAEAAYERLMGDAEAWDNLTATATLDIQDNASFQLSNAIGLLNAFDGRNATAWITTIQQTLGDPFGAGRAVGGVVGYAHGGIPVQLAEAGPELLYFANGGTLPIHERGVYSVPPGTYVSPNNAVGDSAIGPPINVYISGPFHNTDEQALNRWAQESFIPSLRRVIQDERTGQVS